MMLRWNCNNRTSRAVVWIKYSVAATISSVSQKKYIRKSGTSLCGSYAIAGKGKDGISSASTK
jgi:hypothetical protein